MSVDVNLSFDDADAITRHANHALDVALRRIERIVEDHDVAALDRLELVNEFVDEDALLVLEPRQHACALNAHRLIEKHDEESRETERDQKVASPTPKQALAAR